MPGDDDDVDSNWELVNDVQEQVDDIKDDVKVLATTTYGAFARVWCLEGFTACTLFASTLWQYHAVSARRPWSVYVATWNPFLQHASAALFSPAGTFKDLEAAIKELEAEANSSKTQLSCVRLPQLDSRTLHVPAPHAKTYSHFLSVETEVSGRRNRQSVLG